VRDVRGLFSGHSTRSTGLLFVTMSGAAIPHRAAPSQHAACSDWPFGIELQVKSGWRAASAPSAPIRDHPPPGGPAHVAGVV